MTPTFELTAAPVSRIGDDDGEPSSALQSSGAPLRTGDVLELGEETGRFELVRLLGSGGMAEVFLARKLGPEGFVREVALKFIAPGLVRQELERRAFLYEARLACRLRHPNIAEAYDLVRLGERYCLVLEYIEGATTRTALRTAQRTHKRLLEEPVVRPKKASNRTRPPNRASPAVADGSDRRSGRIAMAQFADRLSVGPPALRCRAGRSSRRASPGRSMWRSPAR